MYENEIFPIRESMAEVSAATAGDWRHLMQVKVVRMQYGCSVALQRTY